MGGERAAATAAAADEAWPAAGASGQLAGRWFGARRAQQERRRRRNDEQPAQGARDKQEPAAGSGRRAEVSKSEEFGVGFGACSDLAGGLRPIGEGRRLLALGHWPSVCR